MAFGIGFRDAVRADVLAPSRRSGRTALALILAGAALAASLQGVAAAGRPKADPPCTISATTVAVGETYTVTATGLPTGIAINLWVTDATGTYGSPLGSTPDGTFALNEWSTVAGTTTYTFSGPTKNKTATYASCSVDAY